MIGFSPEQVDACSFWQLNACIDGYNRANSAEEVIPAPTDSEFDTLLQSRPD